MSCHKHCKKLYPYTHYFFVTLKHSCLRFLRAKQKQVCFCNTKAFTSSCSKVKVVTRTNKFKYVGGHTIGIGHCRFFSNRLYNFTGKGDQDPSLNSSYAQFLKTKCKSLNDTTTTVDMDPGSFQKFDSHYYNILLQKKGLFQSDAALLTNKQAKYTIQELVRQNEFFKEFAKSMKRMGAVQVLTGTAGQIRKKCWKVNT